MQGLDLAPTTPASAGTPPLPVVKMRHVMRVTVSRERTQKAYIW